MRFPPRNLGHIQLLRCAYLSVALGLIIAFVLAQTGSVHAQERKLVPRGKEIVVSYKPTRSSQSVGAYAIQHLRLPSDLRVKKVSPDGRVAVVSSAGVSVASEAPVEVDASDIDRVCAAVVYANRGVPIICEANVMRYATRTPNDPYLSDLYGLSKMDAFSAWDLTTGSSSVVVAVIDTGVYYNHADLAGNMVVNASEIPSNLIDDDANGFVDDYLGYDFYDRDGDPVDEHGHGTHCAGIVGGRGDNATGVVGINWNVGILPVRVLGPGGGGNDADVASGIQYAVQRGASIISLSLGGADESSVLDNAIEYARAAGVLVVAAAGNDSTNNDSFPTYPASSSLDNVVAVAGSNSSDELASFSNYGRTSVDVAAPGQAIVSTYLADSYNSLSGTSMATPYVAGIAALMKAAKPALSYSDLKSVLINSVDQLDALQGKVVSGGRVNAYRAVVLALTNATPVPTPNTQAGQEDTSRSLSVGTRRYGRGRLVFGYLRNSLKKPVEKAYVYLQCKTVKARRVRGDEDGYYAFRISRPRRAEKCYAYDAFKNRSRSITVR